MGRMDPDRYYHGQLLQRYPATLSLLLGENVENGTSKAEFEIKQLIEDIASVVVVGLHHNKKSGWGFLDSVHGKAQQSGAHMTTLPV
uniref:Uncharacterized protein n=1 Tax=Arion vulgaris TaxID=1028688 RepID=A0A0B7A9M7_9EUPU